jgi:DNA ligase-4
MADLFESVDSVAKKMKFNAFANLLEKISKVDDLKNTAGKIEEKKRLINKFIEYWRHETVTSDDSNKIDDNFYPAMRLLLPHDDRRVYGLKETKLANYLIDVLCISKTSIDGKKLLHYRAPQNAKSDGDFASVAFFVLKSRCKENVTLSIDEVNTHLDIIATNNAKGIVCRAKFLNSSQFVYFT